MFYYPRCWNFQTYLLENMTKSNRIFSGLLEYLTLWRYKEHNRFSKQMGFKFMALEFKHWFSLGYYWWSPGNFVIPQFLSKTAKFSFHKNFKIIISPSYILSKTLRITKSQNLIPTKSNTRYILSALFFNILGRYGIDISLFVNLCLYPYFYIFLYTQQFYYDFKYLKVHLSKTPLQQRCSDVLIS